MAALYPNIYQRGRKTTLLTQEEAAERLHISPETLKRYEGGRLTPPDETVARMCEVYGARWLALEHAKATDRLGILPDGIETKSLMQSAISLINRLRPVHESMGSLLQIVEDGQVDETEDAQYEQIRAFIAANVAAELELLYATEDSAKKERPEAGTSKRSGSGTCVQNDCKIIIHHRTENASPIFCRGGGASR